MKRKTAITLSLLVVISALALLAIWGVGGNKQVREQDQGQGREQGLEQEQRQERIDLQDSRSSRHGRPQGPRPGWEGNNQEQGRELDQTKQLIKNIPSQELNRPTQDGVTPLTRFTQENCLECVQLLLKAGAKVNVYSTPSLAPIVAAVSGGDERMVALMLEGGGDPNIQFNGENYTLLMDAAFEGNLDVVAMLLDRGAKINQQDREGMSALHYAAREGFTKVVELLIERGADTELEDQLGVKPIEMARKYQHLAIIKLLTTTN